MKVKKTILKIFSRKLLVLYHLQRMSGELEEQADELLALSTIVDARAFNHTGTQPHRGSLEVQVS